MTDLSRTPVTLIGASRGLGRVLAETFHRLGAQVLVVARGQAGLDTLARDLPGVAVLACDASAADTPRVRRPGTAHLDSVRWCHATVPSLHGG
jgi:NAD(P)-dependent dehydrogenase (short-subunit alcohol dehydrogenase family)